MSRLLAALHSQAQRNPHASVIAGSTVVLDWQTLAAEVDSLATRLDGARVMALLLENSPAWVVADLAALSAGCLHIPVPFFFTDDQIRHTLHDAGVDVLITADQPRARRLFPGCSCEPLQVADQTLLRIELPNCIAMLPQSTCKVTYTSGTTGTPRGVRLSLDTLETVTGALVDAAGASAADRALVLLPLSILLENIGSVYAPLLAGAQILLPSASESGITGSSQVDPARLARMLHQRRPSTMIVPPALLKLLVELAQQQLIPDSLRYIAVGGAPVGTALLERARQAGLPVFQGYGLSEAASVVAVNTPRQNRPGSVGKPLPHCRLRINGAGEICIRGSAFDGYLNSAAVPAEELNTGDLGYLDEDGYLYVTGRSGNHLITSYGRNIAPEWIEAELQASPFIHQAIVLGDDLEYPVAVLVASSGATDLQLEQAVQAANRLLPDYARVAAWCRADRPVLPADTGQAPAGAPRRDAICRQYRDRFDTVGRQLHG